MQTITIKMPRPHAEQAKFINCPAKRRVIKAGRRGGKTIGAAIIAVKAFLEGRRVLYATPTQEQIDRFWVTCSRILQVPITSGIYYKNNTKHIIELEGTEQRIKAKTAWDADSLRGDYADLLILDEYQLMNEDAWAIVGAPMLLDNDGEAVFIFTPPSFRTAGVSKAQNKRHATQMYKEADADVTGRWRTFHFSSYQNPHINKVALAELSQDMTALAIRQEIEAEDIEEIPGALWKRATLDKYRVKEAPELSRVFISVDPKTEETAKSECGIVAVGMGADRHGYVLADFSMNGSPEAWASQVVEAYDALEADSIVAEINQGGDMVVSTLKMVRPGLPIRRVRATRGKFLRAEPVSVLYTQGKVHHVGSFPKLEDQQCSWLPGHPSPDRLDAAVHGLTELLIRSGGGWTR